MNRETKSKRLVRVKVEQLIQELSSLTFMILSSSKENSPFGVCDVTVMLL